MSESKLPASYLGDGVYVEFTGYDFRVYTSNGVSETNSIHLELLALRGLINFVRKQGVPLS